MVKQLLLLLLALSCGGCTSALTALKGQHNNSGYEEVRSELADLKHALHGTEVEVKLLEERFENQESYQSTWVSDDVASLQKKLALLEKNLDKLSHDIRSLLAFSNQTTTALGAYKDQIVDLDRKVEESARARPVSRSSTPMQKYTVKAGDSLVKIATKYHVTLDAIKRENNLTTDKIIVGQNLVIPQR
jgi:LysM repeat protein